MHFFIGKCICDAQHYFAWMDCFFFFSFVCRVCVCVFFSSFVHDRHSAVRNVEHILKETNMKNRKYMGRKHSRFGLIAIASCCIYFTCVSLLLPSSGFFIFVFFFLFLIVSICLWFLCVFFSSMKRIDQYEIRWLSSNAFQCSCYPMAKSFYLETCSNLSNLTQQWPELSFYFVRLSLVS